MVLARSPGLLPGFTSHCCCLWQMGQDRARPCAEAPCPPECLKAVGPLSSRRQDYPQEALRQLARALSIFDASAERACSVRRGGEGAGHSHTDNNCQQKGDLGSRLPDGENEGGEKGLSFEMQRAEVQFSPNPITAGSPWGW